MDQIVARAMQKWPNVPNVFGWLRLDRRGNWLVKAKNGTFETIGNRALSEFIGRNYAADESGRWYFQNGAQRVFVTLDYTPWVFRFADDIASLVAQDDCAVTSIYSLLLDDLGGVLIDSQRGVGVLNDRDLPAFMERLANENPDIAWEEVLLDPASSANFQSVRFFGASVRLRQVESGSVADRFAFVSHPKAPLGEPDC
ncbi:MAG: DUF2946 family protein [Burkholderiales bacterium]